MKTSTFVAAATSTLILYSCQKTSPQADPSISLAALTVHRAADTTKIQDSLSNLPFPAVSGNSASCPAMPIYGDTLIYPQPSASGDNILMPVNNPGPGTYLAWPAGMVINHTTGAIDLSSSQTGMKYAIGFVAAGSSDTCISTLILGGASYYDSIYVVSKGGIKADPYYDADPALGNYCSNGNGNGSGCKFDITGSAAAQNVVVNNSSGEIDLKNTLDGNSKTGGVFGTNPTDGQTAIASIYYQLKKGSNNAVQRIDVEFVYYTSASSVPASLQASVNTKLNNVLNGFMISTSATPRPPLVIIVRRP